MSGSEVSDQGVISRQTIVDFSHLTSPDQLAGVTRLERVTAVVVPQSLAGAYAKIPSSRVAATIYVPDGERVNVRAHTGALVVGGDGLGAREDVLVVVGMMVVTSPVTGPVPGRIHVIGQVLAPRGSESLLGPALTGVVGSVSYYPYQEEQDVKVLTGQVRVSGASLANPGGRPDDILIAAGQVVVSGPVADVGYRQVIASGQFLAPEAARELLEPRLEAQGQMAWYRGEQPKILYSHAQLGPDFFQLLDRPTSLIVFADLTVTDGVTAAMVREKVTDIVLFANITAPPEVVSVLQVLTTDAFGSIRTADGPGH